MLLITMLEGSASWSSLKRQSIIRRWANREIEWSPYGYGSAKTSASLNYPNPKLKSFKFYQHFNYNFF